MKIACERCNQIIDPYFDKYEKITRNPKGYGSSDIALCEKCIKDFDNFLYEKTKTFNDAEQNYLQSST